MTGFHQREIEVLPGVAEEFGDEAPVTVAVAEADLLRMIRRRSSRLSGPHGRCSISGASMQ